MMLTLCVALLAFQGPSAQDGQSAIKVVENMLKHYSEAQSLAGTITLTQRAQNAQVQIQTVIQYEKPSKIYIKQTKPATQASPAQSAFISSDGRTFSFSKPQSVLGGSGTYKEFVAQHGVEQTVRDMYGVFRQTAIDPNAVLEVAIGRTEDLKALMTQWSTLHLQGTVELGGQKVSLIAGDYREAPNQPATGSFEAYVTEAGDFVRYALRQRYAVPEQAGQFVEVVSIWDSTIRLDAKPNPALFRG